jgi:hypothetical protein
MAEVAAAPTLVPSVAGAAAGRLQPTPEDARGWRFAVHQPGYHRNPYYFHKMMISDVFISLDNVQFVRNAWQNRQVFYYAGRLRWLTVPVNRGREPIYRKQIVNHEVLRSHWARIKAIYAKTPYFHDFEAALSDVYSREWDRLVDMCDALTGIARQALGITNPMLRASELVGATTATKGALLAEVIQRARDHLGIRTNTLTYNACAAPIRRTHYLLRERPGENRTEKEFMESTGIAVRSFTYERPAYAQVQLAPGTAVQSELSIFDLLFNCGPDSREVLSNAGTPALSHVEGACSR